MKISNGIDIIEIQRIKDDIENQKDKFLNRIYTQNEIEYCESRNVQKYQSYAVRYAAKEAAFKALSEHIDFKYSWKDFEVINTEKGKPILKLHFVIPEIESLDLSLSHCNEYAIASVVVIYK